MTDVTSLLTDNMDVWTSAIKRKSAAGRGKSKKFNLYGIEKLRALILDLAVRGKLVPQDASDEPASELLTRIKVEKEQRAAEGKAKKRKHFPSIEDEEKPYSLPGSWEWARLVDASFYIQRGKGPKYDETGRALVVSQKCVQWTGFQIDAARRISDESLDKYQKERFLQNGDLLWNSTGTGTVGRVNIYLRATDESVVADSHVTVIRAPSSVSTFLLSFLSSFTIQSRMNPQCLDPLVSGTTNQVELNTSAVSQLPIPIPPAEEQQRIVAKVDELFGCCDLLKSNIIESNQTKNQLADTMIVRVVGRGE